MGVVEGGTSADAAEGAGVGVGGVGGRWLGIGDVEHGGGGRFEREDVGWVHAGVNIRWWGGGSGA